VAAEDAQLGQPEIALGIIPGAGGTQRLSRLVGPARAKDLVMTGRFVGAAEAERIGLVDKVVPAADVYDAARELVLPFVTGPAQALRAAKLAIDGGLEMDLASGLAWESQLFAALFATDDKTEGMAAFVEKRKPDFTGR
jgi:enoyl-CoA hydratase/carnithine racemase